MTKATIKNPNHQGKIASNRKEKYFFKEIAALVPSENDYRSRAIVTVRLYSTNSTAYACVWASDFTGKIYVSGGGRAGGYGYHRPSAALESAFRDAGITLSEQIGGVGDDAMERAVIALARAITKRKCILHVAHA